MRLFETDRAPTLFLLISGEMTQMKVKINIICRRKEPVREVIALECKGRGLWSLPGVVEEGGWGWDGD